MIPPKYKFYIGLHVKHGMYTYKNNTALNTTTGEEEASSAFCITSSIVVNQAPIFLDLPCKVGVQHMAYVFCYNDSGSYIGVINADKKSVVCLPDNTYYIRLMVSNADSEDAYKNIINGIDFIYSFTGVNPHYKELSKKYAKESGQEFFRISLDGKINLFGKDYEIIRNSSLEDNILFAITKYNKNSNNWIEYYKGECNKTDCKFDDEKKSCELKTTAIDEYSDVVNKYENTYDIIKLAPAITKINLHKRSLMQVYVKGANSISNFFGGTYWEADVNEAVDNGDELVNKYYFSYIQAGNEFYITGAGISEVNGVYAGADGYWTKWNPGYTCKMEQLIEDITLYKICLYRNSDNKLLYKSEDAIAFLSDDNKYIMSDESIKMVNVNDPSDTFMLESIFEYHIYRRLLCDVDTVEDSEGVKNTYDLPPDDFVSDNRNYKKCIGLRGGLFFCTSRAVDEPTKYGLNDYGQYFTNEFIPSYAGLSRPLPVSKNSWANASLWYVYDDYYKQFEEKLRKQYTLRDSYSIASVIKALLKEINPSLQHEATAEYSHFLYDAEVPIPMERFYVFITQKTNILKGNYDQPAQKAETSLEDIMNMLRDCFRCYWYIENNKFKIEHISFFMKGGSYSNNANIQLDFTKLKDQFNKKLSSYFQSELEYDKTDLNQRYEFGWMDDVTDLFGGITIDVNSNYIQKDKTEEININQFSSDVDYMLFNPSNFSEDGFALLCPIKNGALYELPIIETALIDENGNTYGAIVQNWYASWAYLIQFYMYDMPSPNIKCNAVNDLHVNSIKMCMKHTIEFPIAEDLNELELIKTTVGNGKIDEYSVNMNTRVAKVKLEYLPQ